MSHTRKPKLSEVDSDYQLSRDRERRTIKLTQRFGYVDLTNYALITIVKIEYSDPRIFYMATESAEDQ